MDRTAAIALPAIIPGLGNQGHEHWGLDHSDIGGRDLAHRQLVHDHVDLVLPAISGHDAGSPRNVGAPPGSVGPPRRARTSAPQRP